MNIIESANKKKLLISWGSSYLFSALIMPIIAKLAANFDIYIILTDFFMLPNLINELDALKVNRVLKDYWIVPDYHHSLLKCHFYTKSKLALWRQHGYDIFLTITGMDVLDRYLIECVCSKTCVRACASLTIGSLLRYKDRAEKILDEKLPADDKKKNALQIHRRSNLMRIIDKLKVKYDGSPYKLIKWLIKSGKNQMFAPFIALKRELWYYYVNYFILPLILVGKIFPLTKSERTYFLSARGIDAFIFCDELYAKVAAAMFKDRQVYIASHPAQGSCRCHGLVKKNDAIIFALKPFGGKDLLSKYETNSIYRHISIALRETKASSVHLRPHPRDKGPWFDSLLRYLREQGINAQAENRKLPIWDILCDYLGFIGFVSQSLKDARAACDYAFVVGCVDMGISKRWTSDAKFWLGTSDGIGWIEDDGSYDPTIFLRKKHVLPSRQSLGEILLRVVDKG